MYRRTGTAALNICRACLSSQRVITLPSLHLIPTNQPITAMQISATLLALTASASAAVLHRAYPYDSWNVALNVNHEHDFFISATFTSDACPVGLRNACVENSFATLPVAKRCDHLEFTFSYDGQSTFLVLQPSRADIVT
jgi:hypothetical protein